MALQSTSVPGSRLANRLGCVFVPLALAGLYALGCAENVARFTAEVRDVQDTLSSTPQGSEASVIYRVPIGVAATLVFLPAATRAAYGELRAAGLPAELARRIAAELEGLGKRERPMMIVAESGRLTFSSAFADFADVTDVVFGSCSGRCRVTLRAAGRGVRPRVVKVG